MRKQFKQIVSKVSAVALSLCMAFSGIGPYTVFSGRFGIVTANAATSNYGLISNVQDATILHCFNWSYKAIEENMELIAQSGYSVIQTSPCTQGKDYAWEGVIDTCVGWPKLFGSGNWWKLYQPVAECVDDNGMSYLGSKAELQSMCATAEKYGIKVVVDIVANHMANITGWKNSLSDVSSEVGTYWNPDMLTNEAYWHINDLQVWMSDGRRDFTQGTMGMPDLNTANKTVQRYIYEYLDELIDCGVDGFRFDAAKHIETPDDGDFASDFWPTVLNEAKSHYKSVAGGDLYVYGEVLNTVGDGFDIGSYTKYMSVTDNAAGNGFLDAVRNSNAGNISQHYASDKSVIWAESHDTYMNESSVYASDKSIVRAWAILANKDNAAKLFFARPYDSSDILNNDSDNNIKSNDAIGEVAPALMGEVNTYVWCSKEVAAINHFNNRFAGYSDNTGADGNVMYCQRGNGIVLASFNGAGSVSMGSHGLANGTYTDEVSGNTFTVSGGTLSGTIGSDMGVAVIYQNVMSNPTAVKKAWVAASKGDGSRFAANSLEVSLIAKNCDSASYKLSTGESGTISGDKTIVVGSGLSVGESVTLTLTGKNSAGTDTRTYTYTKTDAPEVAVTGVTINKSKLSIAPGETATLTANVTPTDAANTNVSWTSSDITVASVSSAGVVSAKKNGTAVITVTTEDGGFTAKCAVTVTDEPQPTTGVVYYKNTNGWATPTAYMWNSTSMVNNGSWPGAAMSKTSDSSVYAYEYDTDSEYNMIIFTNAGASQTADLSFAGDGYLYDAGTGTWSVYGGGGDEVAVTGVNLNKSSASVSVNGTVSLTATVTPGNAGNKSVTWSSSDTSVATVNSTGIVTGKKAGNATITVTTVDGGYTAACAVTVSSEVVTNDRIYFKNTAGWSLAYAYMWKDSSANNAAWPGEKMSVLDSSAGIYYIDIDKTKGYTGIIFNNGSGTQTSDLTIPATNNLYTYSSGEWSYYSDTVHVTSVSLNKTSLTLDKGGTATLTANVLPSNATDDSVAWSSSDTTVAKVSNTGVITAMAKGSAVITVKTTDGGYTATCAVTVNENQPTAGWRKDSKGWWYQNADGTYPKNQWKQIGGTWYHFDAKGYMQTGWKQIDGKWYYFNTSGAMKTGWQQISGKWYYFDGSGVMKTGWQKVSGKWYYFDGSGVMKTGWQKVSGKWYYFDGSGVMKTGWHKEGNVYYYLKSDGSMAVDEWVEGNKYYVDSKGHWVRN